ncbi:calcium-dependent phosphotriesterase [Xylariaceae sp. FL0016]|nr:calcium-dependent phosphotriesterase [Xylariaceae sp. FL0016]
MAGFAYFTIIALGALGAFLYGPVKQQATVMGLFRPLEGWENIHGIENRMIQDTVACEDVHYHAESGMLYTACQDDLITARGWMPGAGALEHPENISHGTLVVIDPKTMKAQKLSFTNFEGPFSTHGISLYTPSSDPKTVYIFAVNHLPNLSWTPDSKTGRKTASRIELFTHTVGSKTATHLRTISHPLIRTPNDLLALSEREFLVTNDHHYQEGPMRMLELLLAPMTSWTETVHVRFDDSDRIDAVVALDTIGNNNGLGWGPNGQVLIGSASGGTINFASQPDPTNRTLAVSHSVQLDCIVDNPSYFQDPYAGIDGKDYSGYVLAGVGRGADFIATYKDASGQMLMPAHVWYLPAAAGIDKTRDGRQMAKLVFSDNGATMRGATTGVIVAINPATNGGKREGWLFVAGLISPYMLATRIDFESALA